MTMEGWSFRRQTCKSRLRLRRRVQQASDMSERFKDGGEGAVVYLATIPCRTSDCPVYTVPIPEV